ncbi:MAG: CCR4-NOT regulatory complex component [Watsoniomyces obsoletus]|nr:MAG: CCR4-NOT regulatory complex component [Watsoniomyces obsoletus]
MATSLSTSLARLTISEDESSASVAAPLDNGHPSTMDASPVMPALESTITSSPSSTVMGLPLRQPRNPPYLRSHHRSRSSTASPSSSAPLMTRAHSSPVVSTSGRIVLSGGTMAGRPSSPSNAYRRYHSPSRRAMDEAGRNGVRETVWEENEGEMTSTNNTEQLRPIGPPALPAYHSHTFPRRHRPSSPLHQVINPTTFHPARTSSRAASPIPTPMLAKYNEAYPMLAVSASSASLSSMPSTPTSTRSRSPSVSSLETIPDSPDAEEAALEAERIAQLKAAADAADGGGDPSSSAMNRRRSYLDVSQVGGAAAGGIRGGFLTAGPLYGSRDKRKRWSVCGGERRGDLDLETIWED